MNKAIWLIMALLLTICLPAQMLAGDFDGSKPLICVPIEAFQCASGEDCHRGTAQSIDIPQFLKIDFKKKVITGTKTDGTVRTVKIADKETVEGKLVLQGVQNGRGWSVVIAEETGKMTLSAADDRTGFIVFGACTPQPK